MSVSIDIFRDPLTVNDLNLGGTNLSCLAAFGGPVMPWVALGGFPGKPGLHSASVRCES